MKMNMNINIRYNQITSCFLNPLDQFKKKEFMLEDRGQIETSSISKKQDNDRKVDNIFSVYKITETSILAIKDKILNRDVTNNEIEIETYLDEGKSMLDSESKGYDKENEEEIITKVITRPDGIKLLVTMKGKETVSVVKLDEKKN